MTGRKPIWIVAYCLLFLCAAVCMAPHAPAFVKDAVPEFVKEAYHSAAHQFAGTLGSEDAWRQLEQSHWIADGSDRAPRVVYVFTDLNCPYCEKFWADARPWVESGNVQLRHVIVGVVAPSSPGMGAALLSEKNPAAALDAYESHSPTAARLISPSDRTQPSAEGYLTPLTSIPPDLQAQLDANYSLMTSSGLRGTPAVVWRNIDHEVRMRAGAPDAALNDILGPR
jgi:thiol:disulfide interchange protein DsbG